MKANVTQIGTVAGHNLYRWTWKPEALPIVGDQISVGVMADEVPSEFVHRGADGFFRVDYGGLFNA